MKRSVARQEKFSLAVGEGLRVMRLHFTSFVSWSEPRLLNSLVFSPCVEHKRLDDSHHPSSSPKWTPPYCKTSSTIDAVVSLLLHWWSCTFEWGWLFFLQKNKIKMGVTLSLTTNHAWRDIGDLGSMSVWIGLFWSGWGFSFSLNLDLNAWGRHRPRLGFSTSWAANHVFNKN